MTDTWLNQHDKKKYTATVAKAKARIPNNNPWSRQGSTRRKGKAVKEGTGSRSKHP